MPEEIALSEPVRKALRQLAEIDTVIKGGDKKPLGNNLYVSLLNQKEGLIDFIMRECPGMVPYWTIDGYQLRSVSEYSAHIDEEESEEG